MLVPTNEERNEIINCLKELDCCLRCILRFIGVTRCSAFENPESDLKVIEDVKLSDLRSKRVKRNPCRICLNIFEDATVERLVECMPVAHIQEYNYSDYNTAISFPKALSIRNHSMFLYLKEKFPHIYDNSDNMEQINKIFRVSTVAAIVKKINKHYNSKSNLTIFFEIGYEDDEVEIQNMKNLSFLKKGFKTLSRGVIIEILRKCEDKLFKEQFPVPPEIPNKEPFAQRLQCIAEAIFLGGRYLKFSREMGQTPWSTGTTAPVPHCLQDILFDSIVEILGYDKKQLTFCASGREDVDVRMLGTGRPFFVQIDNPKVGSITFEELRAIEREVFKSKLAAVIKLQVVPREELKRIKEGEEIKRKHYKAICQTDATNLDYLINIINNYSGPLEIIQKTPIRVLHRRAQAARKRFIYSMVATAVPGQSNLFELDVVTQAGTYVKEFVTGDLERTTPSITSILQLPVDIVALDVTSVELNWPEADVV